MGSHPEASRRTIAELAAARLPDPPALTTIEAVVDRVRVESERSALGGPDGFGRRVVADTCPVSMRVHGREDPIVAWGGFVHDVATGTMIAASAGETSFDALTTACIRAKLRIEASASDGDAEPLVEAYLHTDGNMATLLSEVGRLVPLGVDVRYSSGQRSDASRMAALVGRRFGPVSLKLRLEVPSGPRPSEVDGLTPAQVLDARLDGEAQRSWQAAVDLVEASPVKGAELARLLRAIPPPQRADQAERRLSAVGSEEKGSLAAPE